MLEVKKSKIKGLADLWSAELFSFAFVGGNFTVCSCGLFLVYSLRILKSGVEWEEEREREVSYVLLLLWCLE